jgi:uncharacterized membrane protein SpoIIM required for sporulation
MSQVDRDTFVESGRARWERLEQLLQLGPRTPAHWSEASLLYRGVCADLSRAQSLELPVDIQRYLDELAGRAHNRLYSVRNPAGLGLLEVILREFPRQIRADWRFFLLASFLFYGPFVLGVVGASVDLGFAGRVLPEAMLVQMEESYSSPDLHRGGAAGDAAMAGFYVHNNVGIAFRCFATGALAGLGSVFFLVYNGLVIGTVFGHLFAVGYGWNLLAFTSGHSAWELTGIVVSGAAGLRLGWALVVTEGRSRAGSLRAAGPALYRLVVGAASMIAIAAAIEAFWSAGPLPAPVKYAVGVVQFVIVGVWLLLGGRKGEA